MDLRVKITVPQLSYCNMDVFKLIVIAIFSLLVGVSSQLPQNKITEDISATESKAVLTNCTTARGLSGACVNRQYCGHSTDAIDFTLYATRNYHRPCTSQEVCCPTEYQLVEEKQKVDMDDFDDDNDD